MINTHEFNQQSPFKQTQCGSANSYNLTNTTQDLVKFQLQEQYRSSLNVGSEKQQGSSQNQYPLQDAFNHHLQSNASLYPSLTNNVPSLSSTPTSTDDDEEGDNTSCLDSFLQSTKPNYVNLRILVENAAFDSSQFGKESILPLYEVQKLKQKVEEKLELQQYLLSKIALSQQFINEVIHKEGVVESEILLRVIKTLSSLQSKLLSNNKELDDAREKVNNHNLSCMLLGYIEDVKRNRFDGQHVSEGYLDEDQTGKFSNSVTSSPTRRIHTSPKLYESLSAHLASIAVQRDVTLAPPPPPPSSPEEDLDTKVQWLQQCIDAILLKPVTSQSTEDTSSIANNSMLEKSLTTSSSSDTNKTLTEYKTALTDLKFSYQYLAKEYELSRLSSSRLIQDYRKKLDKLEKDKDVTDSKSHRSSYSSSMPLGNSDSIENKDKEITKLRKELHLLKVDHIGASKRSSMATPLKYNSGEFSSPTRTSGKSSNTSDEDDVARQISSTVSRGTAATTSASGVSNSILRSEFKKIVSEMQDFYEQELAEERMMRRKVEEEFNQLKKGTYERESS
ncbi:PEA2 [Candida theae]|uniref:PEA2 n=1 Tax=Candida theae TaxID=1198502 RepID=A0AAD5FXY5_9ASCO|nr:PEA2 [Candida theae]KAI5957561.1 PEA2 [Candida theae]